MYGYIYKKDNYNMGVLPTLLIVGLARLGLTKKKKVSFKSSFMKRCSSAGSATVFPVKLAPMAWLYSHLP